MKSLKKYEKERIMKMTSHIQLCICPSCKKKVYPKFINYFCITYPPTSGLYWCPKCLHGKAGIFWREI